MEYTSWSVTFGEQPSASKWNILGTNMASFNDGSGFAAGALGSVNSSLAAGMVCQVQSTNFATVAQGTGTIPFDNTIPQNTEGDQYMTQTITPKSSTNVLIIEANAMLSASNPDLFMTMALFQDSTANALAATGAWGTRVATGTLNFTIRHKMTAGTTSATTFKIRAGMNAAATTTFNGSGNIAGNQAFGGSITISNMTVWEIKA